MARPRTTIWTPRKPIPMHGEGLSGLQRYLDRVLMPEGCRAVGLLRLSPETEATGQSVCCGRSRLGQISRCRIIWPHLETVECSSVSWIGHRLVVINDMYS
jgi:hypothetical protein